MTGLYDAVPDPGHRAWSDHDGDQTDALDLLERPAWHEIAACKGLTGLFFTQRGERTDQAKAVCRRCPVREECLAFALDNIEMHGIWGGASERERRRMRRARKPVRHGTIRAYLDGCRCPECQYAWDRHEQRKLNDLDRNLVYKRQAREAS